MKDVDINVIDPVLSGRNIRGKMLPFKLPQFSILDKTYFYVCFLEYAMILLKKQSESIKPQQHNHVKVRLQQKNKDKFQKLDWFFLFSISFNINNCLLFIVSDHMYGQFQV
jgi:hypothetical protein